MDENGREFTPLVVRLINHFPQTGENLYQTVDDVTEQVGRKNIGIREKRLIR